MRRFLCLLLCVLFAIGSSLSAKAETQYLRVIAQSNSALAQEEKLRVRDAVLCALPASPDALPAALGSIAWAARRIAPCQVSLRFWQPPNEPPALTLYIEIGAAEGRNWWGVLYPELLALTAESTSAPSRSGDTTQPVFSWPWLAWLAQRLGISASPQK